VIKKTFSVDEILWAFIEHADDAQRAVAVSMAGKPWGYVRIKGPSENSALPGVKQRPSAKIESDPLGQSSGPSTPPFLWAISAENLRKHYNVLSEFVDAVVRACAQAGTPW